MGDSNTTARVEPAAKKKRKGYSRVKNDLPESMLIRFVSAQQQDEPEQTSVERKGPTAKAKELLKAQALKPLDVPLNTTITQMERLLNELLGNEERSAFAFYVTEEKTEIVGSLKDAVKEGKLSTESVLEIKYEELSTFRVNPITRLGDSIPGHTEAILHLSFSPDGYSLASGGGDAIVRFWDVNTRTPRFVCKGHRNHVLCTGWSPDGKRFVSGDKNGEIRVWNPQTGQQINKPLVGHKKWITSLSWEPHHANPNCERLLTGSKDQTARVWNVRTGRSEFTLTGHQGSIEAVRWGGEGLLYTASRDKMIMVWASRKPGEQKDTPFKLIRTLRGHAHRINSLALSNDYINRTGAFDHTGKLSSGSDTNAAYNAAVERYNEAKRQHTSTNPANIPFERLVSCSDDLTLYLWYPTLDKKPVQRMHGHQQVVSHISFSPDGRYLASASFDKKVKLWCGRTAKFISTLTGHVAHVYQVCWAPDSRMLCSASKDSTVKLWIVGNPKNAKETLSGHMDEVYALDWSPNGELLASGGKDRVLKIWTA